MTIKDLRALPQPVHIIHKALYAGSTAFCYGEPGVGKSFFVIDAVLGVPSATIAWGRRITPGIAVYVVGEGQAGLQTRIDAWLTHHGRSDDIPALFRTEAVNLLDDDATTHLIASLHNDAQVIGNRIRLVCFDTLSNCFGDGDENVSRDVRKFLQNCNRIATTFECAVLVVHHTGKDGNKGLRGHSMLRGNADTVIRVSAGDSPSTFVAEVEKQKDGSPFSAGFHLEPVSVRATADGEDETSLVAVYDGDRPVGSGGAKPPKLSEKQQAVYDLLLSADAVGLTGDEWRKLAREEKKIGTERRADFGDARDRLMKLGYAVARNGKFFAAAFVKDTTDEDESGLQAAE